MSYAIGLDYGVPNLLHTLFVAAMLAAHQTGDFRFFSLASAPRDWLACSFSSKSVQGLEEDMRMLRTTSTSAPRNRPTSLTTPTAGAVGG